MEVKFAIMHVSYLAWNLVAYLEQGQAAGVVEVSVADKEFLVEYKALSQDYVLGPKRDLIALRTLPWGGRERVPLAIVFVGDPYSLVESEIPEAVDVDEVQEAAALFLRQLLHGLYL